MPLAMAVKVDAQRAASILRGLKIKSKDLDPVRRDFAEYMVTSTKKTFAAGGRPQKWTPSNRARTKGGKTLIKTGRLRSSITGRVRGNDILVGTNVAYAAAHQFGTRRTVSQSVKAHARRTKDGGISAVRAHTRRMRINLPRRRFLAVLREDKKYLHNRILKHFNIRGFK